MATRMFDTNIEEFREELRPSILFEIERLKRATSSLEKAVRENKGFDAMNYGWITNMQESFEVIKNKVSQINGAVMVRALDEPKPVNPSLVDKHITP